MVFHFLVFTSETIRNVGKIAYVAVNDCFYDNSLNVSIDNINVIKYDF